MINLGRMQDVINRATSYLGSNYTHFCSTLGMGCEHWCAAFIATIFKESNVYCPFSASCSVQVSEWIKQGRLKNGGFQNIRVGNIVYYDYDHGNIILNPDTIATEKPYDHVGLVIGRNGNNIELIEGNFHGGSIGPSASIVSRNTITIHDADISAYAIPPYDDVNYTASATGGATTSNIDEVIANLSTMDTEEEVDMTSYIEAMQDEVEQMLETETRSMEYLGLIERFYGSPFRFIDITDPPIEVTDEIKEGRTFTKNIAMEAPLVHFIPGVPSYLSNMSSSNMEIFKNYITTKSQDGEISEDAINKIAGIEGRYFNFVPMYSEYQKYLNVLCRVSALYLGIGDKYVPGTTIKYKNYNYGDWQDKGIGSDSNTIFDTATDEIESEDGEVTSNEEEAVSSFEAVFNKITKKLTDATKNTVKNTIKDVFGGTKSVKYYVDPGTSFSESVSNSTSQSQLAGLFDQGESLAKELKFWTSGSKLSGVTNTATSTVIGAIDTLATGVLTLLGMGDTPITNIANYANYIISGSNIVFPEMWTDSSYSKSYTCTVNLVSPYGDNESIFINEILPLMSILAMGLPRQTSSNSFMSPMLVRVFSKGWFSCDLGIISSISIEKGGSDSWASSGLPLSLKVSVDIHDLYSSLAIPSSSQPGLFFNNDSLIEFLGATCGVDLLKPNITLKIQTAINGITHMVTDIPTNKYDKIKDWLNNKIMQFTGLK